MIINLQKDYCKITPQTSECKSMQALVLLCYKHNTTVNVACCLGRACFGILLYLLCFSFTVSEGANSNACKNLHAKSQIYFPKTEAKRGASESREGYGHKNNNTRTQKVSQRETKEKKKRAETFPNSTVTLMPRLLSILDSSTSNRSPGWRLLTSGLLALKVSVTVLGETPCKQRRAG